jgi:hypothetical protein
VTQGVTKYNIAINAPIKKTEVLEQKTNPDGMLFINFG